MSQYLLPLEILLRKLKHNPEYLAYVLAGGVAVLLLAGLFLFIFHKYFTIVFKSLSRNLVRTLLSSLAIMILAFMVTLICSVLLFLDLVMEERSKDLKAIVTERYQIPSQMPFAYASGLERGAARSDRPDDVKPVDSMTWQFFGGTLDPAKRSWENMVFFFAMDPHRILSMMDDLEVLDPQLIGQMANNKKAALIGRDKLKSLNKQVGDRFVLTSFNYKDIVLEFEVVGMLPEGRYNQSAIMNRDYLNDALDAYPGQHKGDKHPMAMKTLNLVWLKVPDTTAFQKVADQVMTSPEYTTPSVKCETASSGIASWLDPYRDILWAVKWLVVPGILISMSLVIAVAISISVRERRSEMAVLKVLGYSPLRIQAMVMGEALLVGAGSGLLSATLTYLLFQVWMGGIPFPVAFFLKINLFADAIWWGLLFGSLTSLAGSFLPAWSARTVKVSEVFAKIG